MKFRDTRPWFWILVAALAVVAIGALVIAISANNQTVDQKKIAEEASDHVLAKVAGLGQAVEAADELQAEGKERSEADRKQIQKDVEEAVAEGEAELTKVRRRVGRLEDEAAKAAAAGAKTEEAVAGLAKDQEGLEAEVEGLDRRIARLEKTSEKASGQEP
ncbi:MAG: hypothetical protein JST59_11145 [Actinobacteria bacterium]|nr:hypothetical protein [Actinomycetota bacterium]